MALNDRGPEAVRPHVGGRFLILIQPDGIDLPQALVFIMLLLVTRSIPGPAKRATLNESARPSPRSPVIDSVEGQQLRWPLGYMNSFASRVLDPCRRDWRVDSGVDESYRICTVKVLMYRHHSPFLAIPRPSLPLETLNTKPLCGTILIAKNGVFARECFGTKRSQVQILSARLARPSSIRPCLPSRSCWWKLIAQKRPSLLSQPTRSVTFSDRPWPRVP